MNEMMAETSGADEMGGAAAPMKIVVVLRTDLEPWQRLNVTAFVISGVATAPNVVGEAYRDGSGNAYLPMFKEPVMVFGAGAEDMARTVERGRSRGIAFSIFTRELFGTFNDVDNRAAVAGVNAEALDVVGMAFRTDRKIADKIIKGLKLLS